MIEVYGDAWELSKGNVLCITTNGFIKKTGECVMGRGIAKEAADRFTSLPKLLGIAIKEYGNNVHFLGYYTDKTLDAFWYLYSFPTKHNWFENSDLDLIYKSKMQLIKESERFSNHNLKIYLPRPGCSNGGLNWKLEVKPIIEDLDDRFYIVAHESER
jgi:hypothetical protein